MKQFVTVFGQFCKIASLDQATFGKVKRSLVVKEWKTILLAPKQKHHDNQNVAISPHC